MDVWPLFLCSQVDFNGQKYEFRHRIPQDRVNWLIVCDDVQVRNVNFDSSQPAVPAQVSSDSRLPTIHLCAEVSNHGASTRRTDKQYEGCPIAGLLLSCLRLARMQFNRKNQLPYLTSTHNAHIASNNFSLP